MIFWKMAFNNLLRNRRRTMATLFTLCFGYTGLMLLGGFINYTNLGVSAMTIYLSHVGHISLYKKEGLNQFFSKPAQYQIDTRLQSKLEEVLKKYSNQIEMVGHYLHGMAILSNGQRSVPVIIKGVEPEIESFVKNNWYVKKYIREFSLQNQEEDFLLQSKKTPDIISITKVISQLLGRSLPLVALPQEEKEMQVMAKTFQNDLNAMNATLGPIHSLGMSVMEEASVIAPLKWLQELLGTEGVSSISIYLKDKNMTQKIFSQIQNDVIEKKLPVDVYPYNTEDVGMFYVGTMSFLYTMGFFFFALIMGAVSLSVMNTVTIGVIERSKEIGTLRAVGFQPRILAGIFVRENLIISTLCVVIGALLSYGLAYVVNLSNIRYRPTGVPGDAPFMIFPELWLAVAIAVPIVLLTCLTTYLVSLKKTRQPLLQLLLDTGASA